MHGSRLLLTNHLSDSALQVIKVWTDGYNKSCTHRSASQGNLSQYSYIGLFHQNICGAIALDIDCTEYGVIEDFPCPPTWVTWNPKSRHCHAVWVLADPVYIGAGRQEAWLKSITSRFAAMHKHATPRNNNATQNPFSPKWYTEWTGKQYRLGELEEYIPAEHIAKNFGQTEFTSRGRNCYVFANTIKAAQKHDYTDDQIEAAAYANNVAAAAEFGKSELDRAEIKHICTSVIKYRNLGFPYLRKAKAGATALWGKYKTSVEKLAEKLGVSRSTYYRKKLNTAKGLLSFLNTRKTLLQETERQVIGLGGAVIADAASAQHTSQLQQPEHSICTRLRHQILDCYDRYLQLTRIAT